MLIMHTLKRKLAPFYQQRVSQCLHTYAITYNNDYNSKVELTYDQLIDNFPRLVKMSGRMTYFNISFFFLRIPEPTLKIA